MRIGKSDITGMHQNGIADNHNKHWHFIIDGKTRTRPHELSKNGIWRDRIN